MQIPLRTESSTEAYIAGCEWRDAFLCVCPMHPSGGCSFVRHGSYSRVTPQGLRIARWYCPQGHRTFSLIPDFLASRLPGLLISIDSAAVAAKEFGTMERAADALRGFEVTLPSALRWLRRRMRAVQVALDAVWRQVPQTPVNAIVTSDGLLDLRRLLAPQLLHKLPSPLGFLPSRDSAVPRDGHQHDMGPDAEQDIGYGASANVRCQSCKESAPILSHRKPFRRQRICCASGIRTAACNAAVPTCICNGSGGFAATSPTEDLTNGSN